MEWRGIILFLVYDGHVKKKSIYNVSILPNDLIVFF